MRVNKAYKYRIYPNEVQKEKLAMTFGCVRFIWNKFVESFNDASKPNYTKYNDLTSLFVFLKDVSAGALQQQDQNINTFKKQFFNKNRKTKVGRPSFKHKQTKASYKLPNKKFDIRGDKIYLEKLGLVDIKLDNQIPKNAKLISCTVSRNSVNQYFVSISIECDIEPLPKTGKTIGIDLGIKDFAITSEGDKHKSKRWFRDNQTKLRKIDKELAPKRKKKDSVRYNKAKQRRAKIYNKMVNQRNYFQHSLSKQLVTNYDTICLESLNVKGMLKNHKLSKAISEVSWSSFVNMLKYKALWYGKDIIQIDRFFPSSKTCHVCGCVNDSLKLHHRDWFCEHCNTQHDRDINAAKNIELEGLRIFKATGSTVAIHTPSLNKTNQSCETVVSTSVEALNKQDVKVLFDTKS